jgi:radical SAM superfamily enzyme YgiQ (UPF0313 family)
VGDIASVGFLSVNSLANQAYWQDRKLYAGSIAERPGGPERQYFHVLPYQYGLFQAYWLQFYGGDIQFQLPQLSPRPLEESARYLAGNDLVGYSLYLWNQNYHLSVAKRVKALNPEVINIVGGPQVPLDAETFLRQHPQIDLVCRGEGERAFGEVLKQGRSRHWHDAPGVAWLDARGHLQQTPVRRLTQQELEQCHSPYTLGVFDDLVGLHPDRKWQMPMETSRGCPYGCRFCFWSGVDSRQVRRFSLARAQEELRWAVAQGIGNVFLCDANFGLSTQDEALVDYVVELVADSRAITSFVVQTPCDPDDRVLAIHRKLKGSALACPITVGIQSRSPEALALAGRRLIDRDHLKAIFSGYRRFQAECYCDMILGLPGESYDSFASGLAEVIECGQFDACYVYFFSPFINTAMSAPDFRRTHGLTTVAQLIIDTHADAKSQEYADEYQDIVISSRTMPAEHWRRALVFKWYCQWLFFARTLHLPLCLGLRLAGLDLRATMERFMEADAQDYPVLAAVARTLEDHARQIQEQGAPELLLSPHTRPIYWPVEQWLILDLVHGERFDTFYLEAADLLRRQVDDHEHGRMLEQGCSLNRALFRLPFVQGDGYWQGEVNLKEMYRGILAGSMVLPEWGQVRYRIVRTRPIWKSWEGWHDHLQFCHLQKKHYLYGLSRV